MNVNKKKGAAVTTDNPQPQPTTEQMHETSQSYTASQHVHISSLKKGKKKTKTFL